MASAASLQAQITELRKEIYGLEAVLERKKAKLDRLLYEKEQSSPDDWMPLEEVGYELNLLQELADMRVISHFAAIHERIVNEDQY